MIAKDLANECHKSRAVIQIDVLDANDNAPEFGKNEYTATISENAQKGALVEKVMVLHQNESVLEVVYKIRDESTGGGVIPSPGQEGL